MSLVVQGIGKSMSFLCQLPTTNDHTGCPVLFCLYQWPLLLPPPLVITSDLCSGWTTSSRCHIEQLLLKVQEQLEGWASRIQRINPLIR